MNDAKQKMINKIVESIKDFGEEIREQRLPVSEQLDQVGVLLDTIKFLDNYDENIRILNEYKHRNRWQERE